MNVHLEFGSFIGRRIPPNGTHVYHSIAELDKRTPFLGQLEVCNVFQTEIRQGLVPLLSYPIDEAIAGKGLPYAVRR